MKKRLLIVGLLTSCWVCVEGQSQSSTLINDPIIKEINNPSRSFEDIRAAADSYYLPLRSSNNGEPYQEEKFFRRWEYYTQSRISYPNAPVGGSLTGADTYMRAANSFNVCNSGPSTSPWISLGQNPTPSDHQSIGILISVAVHPTNSNVIYVGSNTSGLWKTTDGGNNWSNITDGLGIASLGINSIAIDPANTNHILAGTGTRAYGWAWINPGGAGVIESTDGGNTWNTTSITSFPGDFLNVEAIRFHPTSSSIVYAVGNKKIYKSTNGGTNWSVVFTNPSSQNVNFIDLEIDLLNPNVIYASTNFGGDGTTAVNGAQFFTSTNGGTTWTNNTPPNTMLAGISVSDAIAIDITPAEPGSVFVLYHNGSSQQYVRKSTDNGATWTLINQSSPIGGWGSWRNEFEVSNNDATRMYAGGWTVYRSTNSGLSWGSVSQYYPSGAGINSTHADVRAMVQLPNLGSDFLIMGNDGGIAKTINNGSNWTNINGDGLVITQFYGFGSFDETENLVGGTQDNGTKFKNGSSNTWLSFVLSGDGGWCEVDYATENIVYASIYDHIYKSTTGGAGGYSYISNPDAITKLGRKFHLDPSNHDKLWWGAQDLYVYDSPSNIWTLKYNSPNNIDISAIDVAPSNGNVVYLAYWGPTWGGPLQEKLLKTTDGGTTWTDLSANFPAYNWSYITDFVIDPYNPNDVWASCAGYWYDNTDATKGINRVLHSTDGGVTWIDESMGLPPFPVNCLAYQNGTDDVVFAGTDAGVYMWNKVTGEWECFNNDLPAVIVTKIEINNCKNKILISTFGRGIWEAKLPVPPSYHVTATQTWNDLYDRDFNTDVVVDPNVVLTIKGKVSFAEGKRLIISKKAKVVLDGGTLTNGCNGRWEGVQIDGDNSQTQIISGGLATYQGYLELKKSGTKRPVIENAHTGVTLGVTDAAGNFIWNTFGGIIQAKDADFLNNSRDIQFMSYPNYNNKSYFNNCLFEVNNTINGGALPTARVTMWNVKNIYFRGCDFKYTAGNAYPVTSRGYGIFSIDAKYSIVDYCSSFFYPCPTANLKRSTIEGWDYGIESSTSNPLINATVNHAIFTNNNFWGAKFSGMHYPVFNSCNVDVGSEIQSCGLYLDNCKYYKLQNNDFTTTNGGYAGVISFNSMTGVHEIYRNTFSDLTVGIAPENDNSGISNFSDGLKMNCNIFTNNQYDVAQMSDGFVPSSVAFVQGVTTFLNPLTLVRNQYAAACGNENEWYIDGSTKPVIHSTNSDANTQPLPQPQCSDILVNVSNSGIPLNYSLHCPNSLNKPILQVKSEKVVAKQDLITLKNNYIVLIDGGNTQSLLTAISSNMSNGNLKNLLMGKSPYLSDEVLIAYLTRTQTPPFGHVKEIVVANSPVTSDVKQVVDNMNLPMGIKQQINNAQVGISERFKLEGEIIWKDNEIQSLVSEEISYYLNDTINPNSIDSVIYLIKTENRPHQSCELVRAYLYKEDYVTADLILDTLELHPGHGDFCTFQRLILDLNAASEKCFVMKTDNNLKQQVEAIAMDETKESQCRAQALLKLVFEYNYPTVFLYPYQNTYHSMWVTNEENNEPNIVSDYEFNVYPNPASENISFIFKAGETTTAKIEIRDVTGRLVETIELNGNTIKSYPVSSLNDAIYFATLFIEGKKVEQKKIVIVK